MALLGRFNSLQILRNTPIGLFLDAGNNGEVLLPRRYAPRDEPCAEGDWLNVFLYLDSEDRLIATTEKPKVQVGGFASLRVVEVGRVGIFLDWGLPKDLLLPHSEEKRPLQVGDHCVVHVHLDARTRRIVATARLDRYLDREPPRYKVGQPVPLLVVERTDLGYKVIVDNKHWGLVHRNEAFKPLRLGQRERGFIREVRADGKISLTLQPQGAAAGSDLAEQIIGLAKARGGVLELSDSSPPALIHQLFGVSKGNFKKAIGHLYRQGRIVIEDDRISVREDAAG